MTVLIVTMAVIVLAAAGVLGVVYTMHLGAQYARSRGHAHHRPTPDETAEPDGEDPVSRLLN